MHNYYFPKDREQILGEKHYSILTIEKKLKKTLLNTFLAIFLGIDKRKRKNSLVNPKYTFKRRIVLAAVVTNNVFLLMVLPGDR